MLLIIGKYDSYENKSIRAALKKMGLRFDFLEWSELTLPFDFDFYDVVFIRSPPPLRWSEMACYLLTVIEHIEVQKVRAIPSSASLRKCDKFSMYQAAKTVSTQIAIPHSIMSSSFKEAEKFLLKNKKIVSKPLIGGGGKDVYLINQREQSKLKNLIEANGYVFLQEYIPNFGYDIRTIVVDGEVVSQYARSNPSDFRYNIRRGGTALGAQKIISDKPEHERFFIQAADFSLKLSKRIGLEMCATDTLPSIKGVLYFIEGNQFFGFKGSKENVGEMITEYIKKILN